MNTHINIFIVATLFAVSILTGCASTEVKPTDKPVEIRGSIQALTEDIAPYNPLTGIGCTINKQSSNPIKAHIVCRSKHSGEYAWNAVTATSKNTCKSQKWSMLFKRPPSLPKDSNGAFGAQMDIKCID